MYILSPMAPECDASDGTTRREVLRRVLVSPLIGHAVQAVEIEEEEVAMPTSERVLDAIECARKVREDFQQTIHESFDYIDRFTKEFSELPLESLQRIYLSLPRVGFGPTAVELAKQQAIRTVLYNRNLIGPLTTFIFPEEWASIHRRALLAEASAMRSRIQTQQDRRHVHDLISRMLAGVLEKKEKEVEEALDDVS